jgi:hypothetical protein
VAQQSIVSDPSIDGPTFQFGNGGVANNTATYFASRGETSGPLSSWDLIQWNMTNYISPAPISLPAGSMNDPTYGAPAYVWENANDSASLAAYQTPDGTWVYGLQGTNGWDGSPYGGANLFLSALFATPVTMNNTVNYSVDLRITNASVSGNGAAFLNTGFTLNFHDPSGGAPNVGLFLQIPITHSEGLYGTNYSSETTSPDGKTITAIVQGLLSGSTDTYLNFSPSSQTVSVTYSSLNLYLEQALKTLNLPAPMYNLADWSLGSIYIGTEVGTTNGGPASGNAQVGVQISNLQLTETSASPTENLLPNAAVPQVNAGALSQTVLAATEQGSLQDSLGSTLAGSAAIVNFAGGGQAYFDPTGEGSAVARLYMAAFGSAPNAATLATDTAAIQTGNLNLTQLAHTFLTSAQYSALYPRETTAQFASHVYQNSVGWTPVGAGLAGLLQASAAGMSNAAMLVMASQSPNAMVVQSGWDGSDVDGQNFRTFEAVMGRAPDTAARMWMDQVSQNNMSPAGIATMLTSSSEFSTIYANAQPQAVLNAIFANAFQRAPDATASSFYDGLLTSGTTVGALAAGIASSDELRLATAPLTHANWIQTS